MDPSVYPVDKIVKDVGREARPPLREVAPGHFSACILD
jgi:hypothetical protein